VLQQQLGSLGVLPSSGRRRRSRDLAEARDDQQGLDPGTLFSRVNPILSIYILYSINILSIYIAAAGGGVPWIQVGCSVVYARALQKRGMPIYVDLCLCCLSFRCRWDAPAGGGKQPHRIDIIYI